MEYGFIGEPVMGKYIMNATLLRMAGYRKRTRFPVLAPAPNDLLHTPVLGVAKESLAALSPAPVESDLRYTLLTVRDLGFVLPTMLASVLYEILDRGLVGCNRSVLTSRVVKRVPLHTILATLPLFDSRQVARLLTVESLGSSKVAFGATLLDRVMEPGERILCMQRRGR